jgi:transcriptional regulator with XRE-family HTH domain
MRCYCNSQSDVLLHHSCDMSTYGERLREARQAVGMTQKALAARTGLSQTTISDGERGRNTGSSATAKLASVLGVEPLWLSEGKGLKQRSNYAGNPNANGEEDKAADFAQSDEITIPDAPPDPYPEQELFPGLYVAERRTVARPPLTEEEYEVLDGYRVASEADRKQIRGMCLVALSDHERKGGARAKQA